MTERMGLVLIWAFAVAGLQTGDPAIAAAVVAHAEQQAGSDLTAPVYADAARELARLRPWHSGFSANRARLERIERARLSAL